MTDPNQDFQEALEVAGVSYKVSSSGLRHEDGKKIREKIWSTAEHLPKVAQALKKRAYCQKQHYKPLSNHGMKCKQRPHVKFMNLINILERNARHVAN